MTVNTTSYIRKPLYVQAVRVNKQNFEEVAKWCDGEILVEDPAEWRQEGTGEEARNYIKVRVVNPKNIRQTKAFPGDWILYTDRGYKVYTNKAFHASFDEMNGITDVDIAEAVPEERELISAPSVTTTQAVQENDTERVAEESNTSE